MMSQTCELSKLSTFTQHFPHRATLFSLHQPIIHNTKSSILKMFWLNSHAKEQSEFSASSTAEQVTQGIDGTGLTAIVTGANSGIGSETARVLALRGVNVVMAVRKMESAQEVKQAIVNENPNAKVNAMELDLSSLASVRKFSEDFNSSGLPLNILINNAGVMATPFTLSKDNIELQFAVNHIAHFLLTNLLLETMKKTALDCKREGRIVNVSSRRHKFSYKEGIRFAKINDQLGYNSLSSYGQSKLANVLHSNELARRLKEDGAEVTANSVHPGPVFTNLFRYNSILNGLTSSIGKYFIKNTRQGASTTCYVALHPQVNGMSGLYFSDNKVAESSSQANDATLARKLWDTSIDLINKSNV